MKALKPGELPSLPREVRALVAEGVYSLYELALDEAWYILITARGSEYYFLSEHGELVTPPPGVRALNDVKLGTPVMLRPDTDVPRING